MKGIFLSQRLRETHNGDQGSNYTTSYSEIWNAEHKYTYKSQERP